MKALIFFTEEKHEVMDLANVISVSPLRPNPSFWVRFGWTWFWVLGLFRPKKKSDMIATNALMTHDKGI